VHQEGPVNVDDLGDGIQPLSVGNRGSTASRSASHNAANYDLMNQGNLGATMVNIVYFRDLDKVAIPTKLFHVASALRQYRVLRYMLLKSTHPLTIEFDRFCSAYCRTKSP
jgi:hypothetical protein